MRLFLAFLIVPLVEIALFIQVGGALGLFPTLGIVILTAALGTFLVRSQGLAELARLGRKTKAGFYEYDDKGKRQGLWPELRAHWPVRGDQPDLIDVQHRLAMIQTLEAVRALRDPRASGRGRGARLRDPRCRGHRRGHLADRVRPAGGRNNVDQH